MVLIKKILFLHGFYASGQNAGYGINKMIGWEHLTGEKVTFENDIDSSTVTYFRPRLGGHGDSTDTKTDPKTDPMWKVCRVLLGAKIRIFSAFSKFLLFF